MSGLVVKRNWLHGEIHACKIVPKLFRSLPSSCYNVTEFKIERGDSVMFREHDGNQYTGSYKIFFVVDVTVGDGENGIMEGYRVIGLELKGELPLV